MLLKEAVHLSRRISDEATRRVVDARVALIAAARSTLPDKLNPNKLRRDSIGNTRNARMDSRNRFGRRISMDAIERALNDASRGSMAALTDISYETMDTDPHLASVLQKRFGAIGSLPIEVRPAKGNGVDKTKALEYADIVRNQMANIPYLRTRILNIAWGMFHGRMAHELKWDYSSGGGNLLAVKNITWIHPRRLSFGQRRELRILDEGQKTSGSFAEVGISLDEFDLRASGLWRKFMHWTPQLFCEYPEREGLAPRCLYWSFFKRFTARERMILVELFGKPWRIITVDPESDVSGEDLDAASEVVDSLGGTYTARMPQGTNLSVERPGERSARTHKEIIEDSDRQISKLVLGQTGTTDGVAAGLNSNQADVMSDEQMLILTFDAFNVSEVLQYGLSNAIIEVNFGAKEIINAPSILLRADRPANRNTEIERMTGALNAGLEISRNEAYEVSGFSVPEAGDTVIRIEQPATPFGSPNPPAPRPVVIYPEGGAPSPGEQLIPATSGGGGEPEQGSVAENGEGGGSTNDAQATRHKEEIEASAVAEQRMATAIRLGRHVDDETAIVLAGEISDTKLLIVDICCDDASSPHEQPSTELGSPEDLLRKGRAEMLRASDKWADEVADAIVGISDAKAIVRKIRDTFDDIDVRPYARALERKMVHGAALGAMDHALELGMLDAPSATAGAFGDSVLLSAFSEKAFKDAVGQFIKKDVVSRAVWDKLRAEIKRRSFTVAGIESQVMRQKIFQSLAQQIEKGADLREFKKTMIADLKAAGLIKSIPKKGVLSASHVDTVFRTNVLNSYNYGRYKHASQPKVIKAFPVWEIVSVVDGRERSAHAAANGKMLLATDPFWKRAYPPFGFNCRCRIISRSAKYLSQVVSGSTITGLPDSGFTSGYSALIAA